MRCPTLNELPPPPPGKSGWPWTEESPQLPDTMPDGRPWPRVSIVTPSYNQGRFIEETIRSVLLQGYPDLEYIIIDGGSTDGSVEIIRKYEKWLTYWVSEPDGGQSDAINKGFRVSTGEILAWLNSDDTYMPGAIGKSASFLDEHPLVGMVYGDCNVIDEHSRVISLLRTQKFDLYRELCFSNTIPQPSAFFRRSVVEGVGLLDTELHYAMDYDLWIRIALASEIVRIPGVIANFRRHEGTKSVSQGKKFWPEIFQILDKAFADSSMPEHLRRYRNVAMSNVYLKMGKNFCIEGEMLEARLALKSAVTYDPLKLFGSKVLILLVLSFLGHRVCNVVIGVRGLLKQVVSKFI